VVQKYLLVAVYMPNQTHNCTVWIIQYSYVVDCYLMNYTVHFFASCRVQYKQILLKFTSTSKFEAKVDRQK